MKFLVVIPSLFLSLSLFSAASNGAKCKLLFSNMSEFVPGKRHVSLKTEAEKHGIEPTKHFETAQTALEQIKGAFPNLSEEAQETLDFLEALDSYGILLVATHASTLENTLGGQLLFFSDGDHLSLSFPERFFSAEMNAEAQVNELGVFLETVADFEDYFYGVVEADFLDHFSNPRKNSFFTQKNQYSLKFFEVMDQFASDLSRVVALNTFIQYQSFISSLTVKEKEDFLIKFKDVIGEERYLEILDTYIEGRFSGISREIENESGFPNSNRWVRRNLSYRNFQRSLR